MLRSLRVGARGCSQRALDVSLKIKQRTMDVLMEEVQGLGPDGEFLCNEMLKTSGEIQSLLKQRMEEKVESSVETRVEEGYAEAKEKLGTLEQDLNTLTDSVAQLQLAEKSLVERVFTITPVPGPYRNYRLATCDEVRPYLEYLKPDMTPYHCVLLANDLYLMPDGTEEKGNGTFPGAAIITPDPIEYSAF